MADFDKLEGFIDNLASRIESENTIGAVAAEIQSEIDRLDNEAWDWIMNNFYPPPRSSSRKFRFASDKQRRWFWAAVSRGEIQVPYQRTFNLLRATEATPIKVTSAGFVLQVEVDTNIAPYAAWVVGEDQLPGHADTGWPVIMQRVVSATPVSLLLNSVNTIYVNRLGEVMLARSR